MRWDWIDAVAAWAWRAGWQGAVLAGLVLVVNAVLERRLPPAWRCALWVLVGVRLVVQGPASPWSLFNWFESGPARVERAAGKQAAPAPGITATWEKGPFEVGGVAPRATAGGRTVSAAVPWTRWAAAGWIGVAAGLVLWRAGREISCARAVAGMSPVTDRRVLDVVTQCAAEMGMADGTLRVVETGRVKSPAVWAWRRTVLILPAGVLEITGADGLRMIVLHELAHVRRGDVWVDRLLGLVRDVHWLNPAAWLMVHAWRREREVACDECVLKRVGPDRRADYGRAVIRVLEEVAGLRRAAGAVGLFEDKRGLRRRLNMIGSFEARRGGRAAQFAGILLFAALAGCALTEARQADGRSGEAATRPAGRTVAAMAADARRAAAEGRYREALATLDEVLRQDPKNDYANSARRVVEERLKLAEAREAAGALLGGAAEARPVDPAVVALEKSIPEMRFEAVPFGDVVDFFRDASGVNFFVNWAALEKMGVSKETPVTAQLKNVILRKALHVILFSVGGANGRLGFKVDEGVVTISASDDLKEPLTRVVYDVSDLLAPTGDIEGEAQNDVSARKEGAAELQQFIRRSVGPGSWRDDGGEGSMDLLKGQLVVSQTAANQREVARLIALVRDAQGIQVNVESRFLRVPDGVREEVPAGAFLTDAEVASFIRKVSARDGSTIATAPRVTVWNGQRAVLRVGSQHAYVQDMTVVQTPAGETRYEPKVGTADTGFSLDVRPSVTADRQAVTVTVKAKEAVLAGFAPEAWKPPSGATTRPAAKELFVQKPELRVKEAQTIATVPNGRTLLLEVRAPDGAKVEVEKADGKRELQAEGRLVVLVRPSILQRSR